MPKVNRRQIGIFRMPDSSFFEENDFEVIQKVMAEVIVIRAEHRWDKQCFEYVAISSHFEEVDVLERAKEYTVCVDVKEGVSSIRFVAVDLDSITAF